ncbi:hypothetical protein EVAR_20613_1 [Eumeta japonica]|uniref:Uncharacterized protein n=1 Tax=Eumeta variegata TaxID=151549 RepID=A0A4C1USP4_EUMVA|nr:hypothetical protein EVAR_20613_1 [Eumeta japonica]
MRTHRILPIRKPPNGHKDVSHMYTALACRRCEHIYRNVYFRKSVTCPSKQTLLQVRQQHISSSGTVGVAPILIKATNGESSGRRSERANATAHSASLASAGYLVWAYAAPARRRTYNVKGWARRVAPQSSPPRRRPVPRPLTPRHRTKTISRRQRRAAAARRGVGARPPAAPPAPATLARPRK